MFSLSTWIWLLYVFMCLYAHVPWVHVSICAPARGGQRPSVSSSIASYVFETASLTNWLAREPRSPLVSLHPQHWSYRHSVQLPAFLCEAGDRNSGPRVCSSPFRHQTIFSVFFLSFKFTFKIYV